MQRLAETFAALERSGRAALVLYLTAGDPDPQATVPIMHALVGAGADVLELGVPFSDPMADGPVIQGAVERALARGVRLASVLDMVRVFRAVDARTPVVLMGYLNPIEAMGTERFCAEAAAAGVDGVLTVDLPPEEGDSLVPQLVTHGLAPILLVAPTTSDERIARICATAQGFVYYVSVKGVTGSTAFDIATLEAAIGRVRRYTRLPVGVGFGVRDAATAAAAARVGDAVIVGSALVERLAAGGDRDALCARAAGFAAELRAAIDGARAR